MTNPLLTAFPNGGTGAVDDVRALFRQRLPVGALTVQEIRDNDWTGHTLIYVLATDLLYKYDASEAGADDGAAIIRDSADNAFVLHRASAGDAPFARVRCVATSNVTISTGLEAGDTIDGVTLAAGDLVLLTAQTTTHENGVYAAVASGAASRAPRYAAYNDLAGATFLVMEGTTYADTLWVCTSNRGGTIGSTAVAVSRYSSLLVAGSVIREKLTANRTYYVRTDGSDSNSGLANSAAGAFLTVQKAVDVICGTLDLGGYTATISIGAGTFARAVFSAPFIGGSLTITGAGATTILSGSTGSAVVHVNTPLTDGVLTVGAVKLTSSGGSISGIRADAVCRIQLAAGLEFGACSARHILIAAPGAYLNGSGISYTISGNATHHLDVTYNSFSRWDAGTITLTGTPAFSTAFISCMYASAILAGAKTFSGSATGARYSVTANGVIDTSGGGASYFPGNSAGSAATGGQYI